MLAARIQHQLGRGDLLRNLQQPPTGIGDQVVLARTCEQHWAADIFQAPVEQAALLLGYLREEPIQFTHDGTLILTVHVPPKRDHLV